MASRSNAELSPSSVPQPGVDTLGNHAEDAHLCDRVVKRKRENSDDGIVETEASASASGPNSTHEFSVGDDDLHHIIPIARASTSATDSDPVSIAFSANNAPGTAPADEHSVVAQNVGDSGEEVATITAKYKDQMSKAGEQMARPLKYIEPVPQCARIPSATSYHHIHWQDLQNSSYLRDRAREESVINGEEQPKYREAKRSRNLPHKLLPPPRATVINVAAVDNIGLWSNNTNVRNHQNEGTTTSLPSHVERGGITSQPTLSPKRLEAAGKASEDGQVEREELTEEGHKEDAEGNADSG